MPTGGGTGIAYARFMPLDQRGLMLAPLAVVHDQIVIETGCTLAMNWHYRFAVLECRFGARGDALARFGYVPHWGTSDLWPPSLGFLGPAIGSLILT